MRAFLILGGLAGLLVRPLVAAPRVPLSVPMERVDSPLGTAVPLKGATVEIRAQGGVRWGEVESVESCFAAAFQSSSLLSLAAVNEEMWRERVENRLRAVFSTAGLNVVLSAADLERWTRQRAAERQNTEVRQRSLPPVGTIERASGLVAVWDFRPLADYWVLSVFPRDLAATTIRFAGVLTVRLEKAVTGALAEIFTVPMVTERHVPLRRYGQSYSRPITPELLERAIDRFGVLLSEQVRQGEATAAERAGRVLSVSTEGDAVVAVGRRHGLVEGSRIVINGREFHVGWVTDSLSVIWAQSLGVEDREALQSGAAAVFKPANGGVIQSSGGDRSLVSDHGSPPPAPAAEAPPSSGGESGANGAASPCGSRVRPTGATPPPD